MTEYGFTLRYVPPAGPTEDSQMIFEVTEFKNGTAVSFREILEVDVDVDPTITAEAPSPRWMNHILEVAAQMVEGEAPEDIEVSNDPAVVKAALASDLPSEAF